MPRASQRLRQNPSRLTRSEQQAVVRDRLIEAAASLFAARGYDSCSIEMIAAAAGYSRGAFYSNFTSKTDIALAVKERYVFVGRSVIPSRATGPAGGEELFVRLLNAFRNQGLTSLGANLRTEFLIHARQDTELGRQAQEVYPRQVSIYQEVYGNELRKLGIHDPSAPKVMYDLIAIILVGYNVMARAKLPISSFEEILKFALSRIRVSDTVEESASVS